MTTFFIISGIVLWHFIIMLVLLVCLVIYDDIRYRIRMHKLYKKALQQSDEQEKRIMDKLKENSYETDNDN